ncbi:MAG: restriction endonuclease, partial [Nitrosopumilaceae archaeon]
MFLKPYVQGLDGINPGGISIKDFSIVAKTDQITARKILDELIKNGIGSKNDDLFNFDSGDRLKFALLILEKGGTIDEVAEHIDWKDFEGLVAEILESKGFGTIRNMILTKPRMEIDVIGIKMGIAMLIDCKHWKRTSTSAIQTAVEKQIVRTKKYVAKTQG